MPLPPPIQKILDQLSAQGHAQKVCDAINGLAADEQSDTANILLCFSNAMGSSSLSVHTESVLNAIFEAAEIQSNRIETARTVFLATRESFGQEPLTYIQYMLDQLKRGQATSLSVDYFKLIIELLTFPTTEQWLPQLSDHNKPLGAAQALITIYTQQHIGTTVKEALTQFILTDCTYPKRISVYLEEMFKLPAQCSQTMTSSPVPVEILKACDCGVENVAMKKKSLWCQLIVRSEDTTQIQGLFTKITSNSSTLDFFCELLASDNHSHTIALKDLLSLTEDINNQEVDLSVWEWAKTKDNPAQAFMSLKGRNPVWQTHFDRLSQCVPEEEAYIILDNVNDDNEYLDTLLGLIEELPARYKKLSIFLSSLRLDELNSLTSGDEEWDCPASLNELQAHIIERNKSSNPVFYLVFPQNHPVTLCKVTQTAFQKAREEGHCPLTKERCFMLVTNVPNAFAQFPADRPAIRIVLPPQTAAMIIYGSRLSCFKHFIPPHLVTPFREGLPVFATTAHINQYMLSVLLISFVFSLNHIGFHLFSLLFPTVSSQYGISNEALDQINMRCIYAATTFLIRHSFKPMNIHIAGQSTKSMQLAICFISSFVYLLNRPVQQYLNMKETLLDTSQGRIEPGNLLNTTDLAAELQKFKNDADTAFIICLLFASCGGLFFIRAGYCLSQRKKENGFATYNPVFNETLPSHPNRSPQDENHHTANTL